MRGAVAAAVVPRQPEHGADDGLLQLAQTLAHLAAGKQTVRVSQGVSQGVRQPDRETNREDSRLKTAR